MFLDTNGNSYKVDSKNISDLISLVLSKNLRAPAIHYHKRVYQSKVRLARAMGQSLDNV